MSRRKSSFVSALFGSKPASAALLSPQAEDAPAAALAATPADATANNSNTPLVGDPSLSDTHILKTIADDEYEPDISNLITSSDRANHVSTELNEPVQSFEAIYTANLAEIESDIFPELVRLPADDVRFESIPKLSEPSLASALPSIPSSGTHGYLSTIAQFYLNAEWQHIDRSRAKLMSFSANSLNEERVNNAAYPVFEVDLLREQQQQLAHNAQLSVGSLAESLSSKGDLAKTAAPITVAPSSSPCWSLPEAQALLQYADGRTEAQAEIERAKNRINLFAVYADLAHPCESIPRVDASKYDQPFCFSNARQFALSIHQIELKAFNLEPLYVQLSLIDIAAKKRVSETFCASFNTDFYKSVSSSLAQLASEKASAAMFTVAEPSTSIYLLIRVAKTLEGDMDEICERYAGDKVKHTQQTVRELVRRLGRFRQPFLWAAVPVFDDRLALVRHEKIDILVRHDPEKHMLIEDIAECIGGANVTATANSSAASSTSATPAPPKKRSTIPGEISVRMRELGKASTNDLSFADKVAERQNLLRCDELPGEDNSIARFQPSLVFSNHIFLHPVALSRVTLMKEKTIACKIQVFSAPDDATLPPLKVLHDKYSGTLVTEVMTSVTYHNKAPTFLDEVKISLPLGYEEHLHVLFTFYHISCKASAKDGDIENEIGRAFFQVFDSKDMTLNHGSWTLPLATQLTPKYLIPEFQGSIKWIDSKKPMFTLAVLPNSSLHTADAHMRRFLSLLHQTSEQSQGEEILEALVHLGEADIATIVQLSPIVLDQLLLLFVDGGLTTDIAIRMFLGVTELIERLASEVPRERGYEALKHYVKYQFGSSVRFFGGAKLLHEELVKVWLIYLSMKKENGITQHSWFFFDVIVKSALQHLESQGVYSSAALEKDRWHKAVLVNDLFHLVELLSVEVYELAKSRPFKVAAINTCFAYFLTDCFTFLNVSTVFRFMHHHVGKKENDTACWHVKFDLLKIVSSHENFVPYNLPLSGYLSYPINRVSSLARESWARHYLVGTLLHEVSRAIRHENEDVMLKALRVLRDLLQKIDSDARFQQKMCRMRIMSMFFPFILTVCDKMHVIFDERKLKSSDATQKAIGKTAMACWMATLKDINKHLVLKWLRRDDSFWHARFFKIMGLAATVFEYAGRDLLMDKFQIATSARSQLGELVKVTPASGGRHERASSAGRTLSFMRRSEKKDGGSRLSVDLRVDAAGVGTVKRHAIGGGMAHVASGDNTREAVQYAKMEAILSNEIILTLVDTCETIFQDLHETDRRSQTPAQRESWVTDLVKTFDVLMHVLADTNASQSSVDAIFTSLKCFLHRFSSDIFSGESYMCAELCRVLLKFFSSTIESHRVYSSTLLLLCIVKNYECQKNNFSRVRIQTSVSLSKLVITDDAPYLHAFETMRALATSASTKKDLHQKVGDFVKMHATLSRDLAKMNKYRYDPEMLADMHFRIAQTYAVHAPDLRLANLDKLADLHAQASNFAEAGFSTLQCCKLIAEFLAIKRQLRYDYIVENLIWRRCSPNLSVREIDDNSCLDEEGVCQGSSFTMQGLKEYFEKACLLFKKAAHFEVANDAYKLLIPIYESEKQYARLSAAHQQLRENYDDIAKSTATGVRLLGTYYRVLFHGARLDALDGCEFVYKERAVTPLPQICERLMGCYRAKFGDANVMLVQDSGAVSEKSKAAVDKVFIQVTFVEPYFTKDELAARQTTYDRSTDVNTFAFDTPFTKGGKAHGSVDAQWMRKTIIVTERPFPFLTKRLRVVDKREFDLSPLQVAIEAMHDRWTRLKSAIEAKPQPNAKAVQILLQGSIRLQVNSGPMEYARAFLSRDKFMHYNLAEVNQLISEFREFLAVCGSALALNRQKLIKDDQLAYQEDLEDGFAQTRAELEPYLDDKIAAGGSQENIEDKIKGFLSGNDRDELLGFFKS